MSKLKNLQFQLSLAILLLISLLVSGIFIFSPISIEKAAQALNPADYNKAAGDPLAAVDWNRLDDDFLAKSGGALTGDLTVPNLTVTGTCTNCGSGGGGSVIENTAGTQLNMVCGSGPVGGWLDHGPNSVQTVINTSAAGFINNDVKYIVSLSGSNAGVTVGLDTLYNITASSFELHVSYLGWNFTMPGITGDQANLWGWQAHWCGIGMQ